MTAVADVLDFAGVLAVLNYVDGEFVSIAVEEPVFHTAVAPPADVIAAATAVVDSVNAYFGVNPVKGPAREGSGRGTESDVTRLAALVCDLDIAPGKCPTRDVALAIIARLSILLGTRPSVIVDSGHGLHAYWPVEDGTVVDGDIGSLKAILARWRRLVTREAERLNATVDAVYDLPRILRLPGSHNNKHLNGQGPIPVIARRDQGGPLGLDEIRERFDNTGIDERTGDAAVITGAISSPEDWTWGDRTCGYMGKVIREWVTDMPDPGDGRHHWMLSKAVRLACAHRLGCLTEADHQDAVDALSTRFAEILADPAIGAPRLPRPGEFAELIRDGVDIAATKTDDETGAELGPHTHDVDPGYQPPPPGSGPIQPDPSRYFPPRGGFQALLLAGDVMHGVACGYGFRRFYTYENGVWSPGEEPIEAEIVRLLGNRYRHGHLTSVCDIIKYTPGIVHIIDNPLAEFVNVPNGMVVWRTGEILPHDPVYRSTVQLPVEYTPGADCPLFKKFLREVLPADLIDSGFIWELIAYTVYSGNPFHTAILLHGAGRNGKGVLIRVLKALLGTHNCSSVDLYELVENRFRTAELFGKLANLAGDLDAKWLENTAKFKKITGEDMLQGEEKYMKSFDFTPWALPFYSTNKPFGSADSSQGWMDRWVVVPFPNTFTGHEDRELTAKLTSEIELRGILAHAIAALPAVIPRGQFLRPQSLIDAKNEFMVASDSLRAWVDEDCDFDPAAWIPRKQLFQAYRTHAGREWIVSPLGPREFYNRIGQMGGIRLAIRDGNRGFAGIKLKGQPANASP